MGKNEKKLRNQDINPCIEESDASHKCLDAYNYDKSMCSAYFKRYKDCRKYWPTEDTIDSLWNINHDLKIDFDVHNVMLERRRNGVKPDMPTAAERQEMLAAIGGKPY